MRYFFSLILFLATQFCFAQYTLRIEIIQWPQDHGSDTFFIAGNFNQWYPDKNYFIEAGSKRVTEINDLKKGRYEFKITRGSWQKTESLKNGNDIGNREISLRSDTTILLTVDAWKDDFKKEQRLSTASGNVSVIDTGFYIPQLDRYRCIWIYLPNGYLSSAKKYPVLYMQDGQNIFDASTGFSGEWGVDECLDTLKKNCIVVGVDHGADKRLTEYTPYKFSAGSFKDRVTEGKKYVEFLVKTLKPFIDKKYRTLKNKNNTFIAGSSLGGLISYYAVMTYPSVFGAAGVLSPAFWVVKKNLLKDIGSNDHTLHVRIYFMAGDSESKEMLPDMNEIAVISKKKHQVTYRYISVAGGKHTESFWRQQLPDFFMWLLK